MVLVVNEQVSYTQQSHISSIPPAMQEDMVLSCQTRILVTELMIFMTGVVEGPLYGVATMAHNEGTGVCLNQTLNSLFMNNIPTGQLNLTQPRKICI